MERRGFIFLKGVGWQAMPKDPGDTLDYSIDYTAWLDGDTIVASTWVYDPGITGNRKNINPAAVVYRNLFGQEVTAPPNSMTNIWLSGGQAGQTYKVANTIVTAADRIKVQSFKLTVLNQ